MNPGPISSCSAPLRSGWDTLYQDVCHDNALACLTLLDTDIAQPDSRKVGSFPYKRRGERRTLPLGIPLAHHHIILGGRRCVYNRVAIYGEADCDHRVMVLGWRLVQSIQKLKDVHTRWYVSPT
jgi:hypothetical protein